MMQFWMLPRPKAVIAAAMAYLLLIGAFVTPVRSLETQQGQREITCVNSSSGARWQIEVDYDQKTVDTNPATIGDSRIAWRDAKDGWRYSLDLKTGELYVVFASSMGGNTYFHRCLLDR
jgi:hypothetical protein